MINNKPIYLWPFILVYRMVNLIFKFPILFVRYFCLGFFFATYFFINLIVTFIIVIFNYSFTGLLVTCYGVYKIVEKIAKLMFSFIKYFFYGLIFPFVLIFNLIKKERKKESKLKKQNETIKKEKTKQNIISEPKKKEQVLVNNNEIKNKTKKQLAKEEKEKLRAEEKQLKLEREAARKEERLKRKEEKRIKKLEEKNKEVTEQKGQVAKEETKEEYQIFSPQSEILEEEKKDEERLNKVLTKEERRKLKEEKRELKKLQKLEKQNKPKLTRKEKKQLKLEREAARKEERLKKEEEKRKLKEKMNEVYINENVVLEKVTFQDKLLKGLKDLNNLPDRIAQAFSKRWQNSALVKHEKNKKAIDRQALLINFEGEDAKKSDKKIVFEYVGKNPDGKIVKDYFEAFSKVEVHSFLLSEGFEVYSIRTNKLIQLLHSNVNSGGAKIKTKDLIFFLTQLSTYIKAGIPLVESLKILSRQYKNKTYQSIFRAIIYDLTMGENFSEALSKQGDAFPRILINMIKASEMTGELPEALDDMADYFTETDKTRKQMVTAMMYPSIIFVISIAAVTFIMVFVVPQFVEIYDTMDNARLPWITQLVINISDFLESNLVIILIVVAVVVMIFVSLYKKVKIFRTICQYLVMHFPVFGNVIIYNEVTMFTKTFCSLLSHNVFITDSMDILNKLTNNEIYKMIILDTITNLARGEKISLAFKDHWAVPIPAYEMIVTGERTGQLAEMMGKVSAYYQDMHKNAVARIKTFLEPALILFLTGVVGGIVLSIIIPMFDMYNNMGL